MLYVLVTVLAALLGLLAAVLAVVWLRSRRRFKRLPGAFRCRVRVVRGAIPDLPRTWRGRRAWASWAHDVLLIRLGRMSDSARVLPMRFPEGSVTLARPSDIAGLGSAPVTLRLRLDSGDVVEVAASGTARDLLAGPFLVAAISEDGSATEGRQPGR